MTTLRSLQILATAAVSWLAASEALTAAGESLSRPLAWTTAFAEEEVKFLFQVAAEPAVKGRLIWALATSEKLVISRGEVPCDSATELEVKMQLPEVRPGVVFDTLLTARLHRDGEREPVATYESPLHIFPRDPFYDVRETLKKRTIKLFDPPGETAKVLTNLEFPFEQIFNVSAIGELNSGLLLIGEGTSFRDERTLAELVVQAVARGVPVLCLAPSAGDIELPRPSDEAGSVSLVLERSAFVRRLGKRFDDKFWMQHPVTAKHSLTTSGRPSQLLLGMEAGDAGWRWLELQVAAKANAAVAEPPPAYSQQQPTKLIVMSLPIIAHWESGPTPRFMFARLLDYVTPTTILTPEKGVAP